MYLANNFTPNPAPYNYFLHFPVHSFSSRSLFPILLTNTPIGLLASYRCYHTTAPWTFLSVLLALLLIFCISQHLLLAYFLNLERVLRFHTNSPSHITPDVWVFCNKYRRFNKTIYVQYRHNADSLSYSILFSSSLPFLTEAILAYTRVSFHIIISHWIYARASIIPVTLWTDLFVSLWINIFSQLMNSLCRMICAWRLHHLLAQLPKLQFYRTIR
jgi:hypothetical protein